MRGATALLSLAMAVVVVAAPVSSAWHELTVQHVRCAEHGELTHVATTHGSTDGPSSELATVQAQESGTEGTEGHDHCSLGRVVRSGVPSSLVRTAVRYVPPAADTRTAPALPRCPGRAFVLASAPKTSPPSV
jgi:hypothetical protein